MDFPPRSPRDVDFTEIEAILRVHDHPPFGAYVEAVRGQILDADFWEGWHEGALPTAPLTPLPRRTRP